MRTNQIDESNIIIKLWDHKEIGAVEVQCGLSGSPTKVKQIESVVLAAHENSKTGLESLIKELMHEHIIG